jgi:diketogulonate reductase-like aldo/keto reductase
VYRSFLSAGVRTFTKTAAVHGTHRSSPIGLTIGGSVIGDPVKVRLFRFLSRSVPIFKCLVQDIIKTAFENGINMFDTAEDYSKGNSEREM